MIFQSGNINGADNTESNGNSNSENAVNVMLTPPGVGRRKRDGDIQGATVNSKRSYLSQY